MAFQHLNDSSDEVRTRLIQIIHSERSQKKFAKQYLTNLSHFDKRVRGVMAYSIGELNDLSLVTNIEHQWNLEKDPETKHKMLLALSRLSIEKHLKIFLSKLRSKNNNTRLKTLREFEYVNNAKLCIHLLPLLGDHADGQRITAKYKIARGNKIPDSKFARICDAAVTAVGVFFSKKLGFETNWRKVYSKYEIEKTRGLLRSLK